MSEWKTYKLGDFAEINPTVSLKQGHEYTFVEMKDLDATFKSAKIQEICKNNYVLTSGRYIDFKEAKDDEQAFDEKMLKVQMHKANELDEAIRENLKSIGIEL